MDVKLVNCEGKCPVRIKDTFWQGSIENPQFRPCCREIVGRTGLCNIHQAGGYEVFSDRELKGRTLDPRQRINYDELGQVVSEKEKERRKRMQRLEEQLKEQRKRLSKLESQESKVDAASEALKRMNRKLQMLNESLNVRREDQERLIAKLEKEVEEEKKEVKRLKKVGFDVSKQLQDELDQCQEQSRQKDDQVLEFREQFRQQAEQKVREEQQRTTEEIEREKERLRKEAETRIARFDEEKFLLEERSARNLITRAGFTRAKLSDIADIRKFERDVYDQTLSNLVDEWEDVNIIYDALENMYVFLSQNVGFLMDQRILNIEQRTPLFVRDKLIFGHIRDLKKLQDQKNQTVNNMSIPTYSYPDFIISYVYDEAGNQVPVQLNSGQYVQPIFTNNELGFIAIANRKFHWRIYVDAKNNPHVVLVNLNDQPYINETLDNIISSVITGNQIQGDLNLKRSAYIPLGAQQVFDQQLTQADIAGIQELIQRQQNQSRSLTSSAIEVD